VRKSVKIILFLFLFFGCIFLYRQKVSVSKKRELHLLAWPGTFDKDLILEFEQKYNVRIHIGYYTTNEELLSKIFMSKKGNIDMVVPSGYALKKLYDAGYVFPLLKEKIYENDQILKKLFIEKTYATEVVDEAFMIGVPFEWHVYGCVIRDSKAKEFLYDADLFHLLFQGDKKRFGLRLGLPNDPILLCQLASIYCNHFFSHALTEESFVMIIGELLKKQKKMATVYSDYQVAKFFKDNVVDIMYAQSYEYCLALREMKELTFILIPEENGPIASVEYIACISEKNIDLVYDFINFFFEMKNMVKNTKSLGAFPPIKRYSIEAYCDEERIVALIKKIFSKKYPLTFVDESISSKNRALIWGQVKSF